MYDGNDNLLQRFEYVDDRMPVAMTDKDGNRYYLHYDQVGSLRAVSDTNHNIIKEITYDTYGNILKDTNPSFKVPFGFAGGLYDPDTKLTHFGYREYDAYTGKWTAKDPIGFAGGDSNLYGYVLGDPVGFVDSWGLYHDPRFNGRGVPRLMGGDGGISDSEASINDHIAMGLASAASFASSAAVFGVKKTAEFAIACIVNAQGVSGGIDNAKARSGRGRGPVSRELLDKQRRTRGHYIRIRGVRIWIPW